jgi:hypothetical protein
MERMNKLIAPLIAASCLLSGCDLRPKLQCSGGSYYNASWEKFWRTGNGKDENQIEFIVYGDYNPGRELQTEGISIYGEGSINLDGLVVNFSKTGKNSFGILNKTFDLNDGRFFYVYRKNESSLAVKQESLKSPLAQKIIKEKF